MKTLLFFILVCFCFKSVYSQVDTTKIRQIGRYVQTYHATALAELADDTLNERYFSKGAYDRFFDKYFTQIKYERESFTEGNSASLNVTDNKTRLNLTLSQKSDNWIFSLGTSLNISDNSGVLFSGDKPTAGTEFSASFSYLVPRWRFLKFQGPAQDNNYTKRRELLDSLNEVYYKRNPNYAYLLLEKIQNLNSLCNRYENIVNTEKDLRIKAAYRDSLVSAIDKRTKALQEAKSLDDGITSAEDFNAALTQKAEEMAIVKQLETDGVTLFRFRWLTGGVLYRRDSYSTYDSLLYFSKRIDSKNFDKWTLNATYNFFWQRTDSWIAFTESKFINSVYANINYSLIRTNTFEDLKDQTLAVTRIKVQNDTTYEFATQKKIRDISKKDFSTSWMHRIGAVGTAMIGKRQFFGINVSAQANIKDETTVWNGRFGLLFRFKDSETEKSKVNFELFLALNDFSDEGKSNKSAWNRKEIGISANVPFQKVFFR